jgi:hypothetical protein
MTCAVFKENMSAETVPSLNEERLKPSFSQNELTLFLEGSQAALAVLSFENELYTKRHPNVKLM